MKSIYSSTKIKRQARNTSEESDKKDREEKQGDPEAALYNGQQSPASVCHADCGPADPGE